jgi:hypothetical protein
VSHEPASAPKRTSGGPKLSAKHGPASERVQLPQPSERPSRTAYQQIAEEYDQAIRGYADYYLQQQGLYVAGYGGRPGAAYGADYAGNAPGQGYAEAQWPPQAAPTGEERIYLLEQAARDFHQALPYIRSLSAGDKVRYLASWRDYLTAMAGMGAELIDALEKELASLTGPE